MNWAIALPEIVLSVVAMAILIFGVLRRDDTFFLASMFALGGFLLAALWSSPAHRGTAITASSSATRSRAFVEGAGARGAALSLILSLDYNRNERDRALRVPRADAALGHRHDDDGVGQRT